ncbi:MAG TPA: hypothetical protein VJ718_01995 [Candidatus Binataceae bacterium]|nr:hypothetical protein [Candidatus Binataceae bacterium]
MPNTTTFIQSAELYDAVYSFKNYAREAERLRAVIDATARGARTLLDVACGAGEHDRLLGRRGRHQRRLPARRSPVWRVTCDPAAG